MEYERCSELEDHRCLSLFISHVDETRALREMGGEDYRQAEGEAEDLDTQACYEIEDHRSFSLYSSDDEVLDRQATWGEEEFFGQAEWEDEPF